MPCCTEQHRHIHKIEIQFMCANCGFYRKVEMIPDIAAVEVPLCSECFCRLEANGWNNMDDRDLRYLKESLNAIND